MYYTVNDQTARIVECSNVEPDPQEQADKFGCPVYIIEGGTIGLAASPSPKEPVERDEERLGAFWER